VQRWFLPVGLIFALLVGAYLFRGMFLSENRDEKLYELPSNIAEHLRVGSVSDAAAYVDGDFEAHGLNKEQLRLLITQLIRERGWKPYVAEVFLDESEEDSNERTVDIIGMTVTGDPETVALRTFRPFRAKAKVRWDGAHWKFVGVQYEG